MRAVALDDFDTPPALREDLPEPVAGAGEILIRVHASSVNPADAMIAAGLLRGMAEYEFPVVLGRDFAGTVEQVGAGAESYRRGDDVFGFLVHADPAVHNGSWSELAAVPADRLIAPKPANVGLMEAGAAPLVGVTAMAAIEALDLRADEPLLVVGATGGVGSVAVQLARLAGARVIAPTLPEDREYLDGLGVEHVVARDGDVAAAVRELQPRGVAALLDTVSMAPEALDAYAGALADGGRVASPVGAAGDGPGRHNVMGSADPGAVRRIAELLEAGRLRVPIQRTYALEDAGAALSDLTGSHTQGKLAITIDRER